VETGAALEAVEATAAAMREVRVVVIMEVEGMMVMAAKVAAETVRALGIGRCVLTFTRTSFQNIITQMKHSHPLESLLLVYAF
jgi:hypothetical protein